ncbi:GDSL-type esterase/lipase family protein [Aurantimonas sp. A2-1-M11]|uniref:GDSL-type esterase/lipase family protein n=1 Tax=Aurantimonas sp. A2-1-M11 TaxID=3113712 RepID=UPI002F934ED5
MRRPTLVTLGAIAFAASFLSGAAMMHFRLPQLLLSSVSGSVYSWETQPLYRHRADLFERLAASSEVTMIGDSITALGEWSEILPRLRVANRGISGDTTQGVQKRLGPILATDADVYAIMLGVNDFRLLGASASDVFSRYETIVDALPRSSAVVVFSTLLVSEDGSEETNEQVRQLNSQLSNKCKTEKCAFVDLNASLAPNGSLDEQFSLDGLHLNGSGYLLWADIFQLKLRDVSPQLAGDAIDGERGSDLAIGAEQLGVR